MQDAPLKAILNFDAATCLAMGLALTAASGAVAGLTALPAPLLFYAGAALLPIAAFMFATGMTKRPHPAAVWLIVLGNVGWTLASFAVLATTAPNLLGTLFVAGQALFVALLAYLEWKALAPRAAMGEA